MVTVKKPWDTAFSEAFGSGNQYTPPGPVERSNGSESYGPASYSEHEPGKVERVTTHIVPEENVRTELRRPIFGKPRFDVIRKPTGRMQEIQTREPLGIRVEHTPDGPTVYVDKPDAYIDALYAAERAEKESGERTTLVKNYRD